MKTSISKRILRRKQKNLKRLAKARRERFTRGLEPRNVIGDINIKYERADRTQAINHGGIGAMIKLARHTGLVDLIDAHVRLLKVHAPYRESDHVLALVINALAGGTRLEHLELLRNDPALLDAVGADSIPDPTTAGDFCRRFDQPAIASLLLAIDEARLNVWKEQDDAFFDEAQIDADGILVNMVMTSLAWTLKAWSGLLLPIHGRHKEKHTLERQRILRMEFRTFLDQFISIPCQILRHGRQVIYRLLSSTV